MVFSTASSKALAVAFLLFNTSFVMAAPPIDQSAAGAQNVGKANGSQFITGQCFSDADCASGCCAFRTGKCAGAVIAQTRDGGCGFGDPTPNNKAAVALLGANAPAPGGGAAAPAAANNAAAAAPAAPAAADPNAPGAANVGKKNAQQFITGQCTSDADCASGCCGFKTGKCAGAVIAQTRDGGCGFGDPTPNNKAAVALVGANAPAPGGGAAAPAAANNAAAPAAAAPAAADPNAPGAANVGKANGSQFITGQCTSDADCASGCCGFKTGKCAGAVIAQTRDGGCGFGNATPNDNAAKKLQGRRYVKKELLYGESH
jgi:hypothetical protein